MNESRKMRKAELVSYGFQMIGAWQFSSRHKSVKHLLDERIEGINFSIPSEIKEARNVVYAFLADDEVIYVGETTRGMSSRFEGYRYGNPNEADTDNNVKKVITKSLQSGIAVSIWYTMPVATLPLPNRDPIEIPASKPFEEYLIGNYSLRANKKNLNANK